jgi:methionyl-tRNA synthetase
MMSEKNDRIIVTSALPYVNNVPHLGNLVCVISADVYTRFMRLMKRHVISVLGTDEHGTTSETKAIEEGLTPKELCDKYFKIHKEIYEWFNNDYDCFGRTSSRENAEITVDIFHKLHKNGYIIEDTLEQLYCEHDERFLADRFVEGQCPKCNYEHARGDQCENCGSLLNAHELLNAKCKLCKNTPILKKTKHLFIDLPKIEPKLREWMLRTQSNWSDNARTMTEAWLKEGLRPRGITRDLKWGIPVPLNGFENKVFYSWFDAPIGYIGITAENMKDWKDWWFNPDTVKLVQFMGKDNIPFHTILFPSFLIGTNDDYTLMKEISVNEFLNYNGGQFSKSRNIGVFGDDAKNSGIPADVYRYYLMINRPEKTDSDFTWEDFQKKNNAEIVGNLGNLVNRTMVFLNKSFNSIIPEAIVTEKDEIVLAEIKNACDAIRRHAESIDIKEALKEIMHVARIGNQYFQDNEPWKNPDMERRATCLHVLVNIVKDISILIYPYMPMASASIRRQLNIAGQELSWDELGKLSIKHHHKINTAELLFKKIEDADLKALKEKFSGKKNEKDEGGRHDTSGPGILQLRVARITKVERHPKAEKLYIEHIDLGDEQRIIVSGLVPYYRPDELLGRKIIVVTNLEPANLRGVESNGMLLAGEQDGVVELLDTDAEVGEYVNIDGVTVEDIKKLPKISIKEFGSVKLEVRDSVAYADGKKFITSNGDVTVHKISDGKIR